MPSTRYRGRHRLRRTPRAAAWTAAGTLVTTGTLLGTAHAATDDDFARLRVCESGNNYRINTGNGYYGAYQFDIGTWRGLGFSGRPDQASKDTQDAAARKLQAQRGWSPWPACSRKLGLRESDDRASRNGKRPRLAPRQVEKPTYEPAKAPAFAGTPLRTSLVGQVRADVRAWQAQMRERGWTIAVDGRYGPQSASIAAAFQRQLGAKGVGVVGPVTWRLTWEAAALDK